jgi:hypothetical protein
MNYQRRRTERTWLVRAAIVIAALASVLGFTAMIIIAIQMVISGRGMETYRTAWTVEDSWIGFLSFVACAFGVLIVGLAFRLREYLRLRSFEKKYGRRGENR